MSDMSEMLARIALVIQSFDGHALSDGVELGYDAIARAVLGAMREPTAAMIERGDDARDVLDNKSHPYIINDSAHIWLAMIEAALVS